MPGRRVGGACRPKRCEKHCTDAAAWNELPVRFPCRWRDAQALGGELEPREKRL